MICSLVQERLDQIASGERSGSPFAYALLCAHLVRCANCRRELRRLRRLAALSQQLPAPALPIAMRASVLAAASLPAPPTVRPLRGVSIMRLSLTTGTCLTLILAGSLFLLPRQRAARAAEDVHLAVARAHSWHLKGWQMDGKKRILWEVWGQRSPFFYRERVGDQEVLDDGQHRYIALPSSPNHGGFVLKTASQLKVGGLDGNFPFLSKTTRLTTVWKREGNETTYSLTDGCSMALSPIRRNDLYTFAGDSSLPIRYSQHLRQYPAWNPKQTFDERIIEQGPVQREWEDARLDAEYDVPFAPEVARMEDKPGYRLLDLTTDILPPGVDAHNAVVSHGVTMQAKPVMMDAQGNIAIVLRNWIGDAQLGGNRPEDRLPIEFTLQLPDAPSINSIGDVDEAESMRAGRNQGVVFHDDRGRTYLPVRSINGYYYAWQPSLLVLAPLEPLGATEPLPRSITIQLHGDAMEIRGTSASREEGLFSAPLTLTVSLPAHTRPFDHSVIVRDILHIHFVILDGWSLDEALLNDRAEYYMNRLMERSYKPEMQPVYQKAVFWNELALEKARPMMKRVLTEHLASIHERAQR